MTKPPQAFRSGVREDWNSLSFETVSIVTRGAIMPLIATLGLDQHVTTRLTRVNDSRGAHNDRSAVQHSQDVGNPFASLR